MEKLTHECNTNTYCSGGFFGCTNAAIEHQIFECSSFDCVPTPNSSDPAQFECQKAYGCNAMKFDCTNDLFKCQGNGNFICTTKHDCATKHDCGTTGTPPVSFTCTFDIEGESYECLNDFSCITSIAVTCSSSNYACASAVSCTPSGSPYAPPPQSE